MSLSEQWLKKFTEWEEDLRSKHLVHTLSREDKQFFVGSLDAVVLNTSDDDIADALKAAGRTPLLAKILAGYRSDIRTKATTDKDFSAAFNEYAPMRKALEAKVDKYLSKDGIVNRVLATGTILANIGDVLKMVKLQDQLYKGYLQRSSPVACTA